MCTTTNNVSRRRNPLVRVEKAAPNFDFVEPIKNVANRPPVVGRVSGKRSGDYDGIERKRAYSKETGPQDGTKAELISKNRHAVK